MFRVRPVILVLLASLQYQSIDCYTYRPGTFTTTLNCQWFCMDGSRTSSCFCVLNGNTSMLWADAQTKCVSDGGYLATILSADEQMMMETLVGQYGWNKFGVTSNTDVKMFYIGLQRNYCYTGTTNSIYYWRDNCQQPITNDTFISQLANGYTSSFFTLSSKPNFPRGSSMDGCTNSIFWYTTDSSLGPWQDDPYGNDWIGQYSGAYCRRDINPCASNPCPYGQTCLNNNSCWYCLPTTTSTGVITTADTCEGTSLTLNCDGGIITVLSAVYGRLDPTYCPSTYPIGSVHLAVATCIARPSLSIVNNTCNGLSSCVIAATNGNFGGDPCGGTFKYLTVTYSCSGTSSSFLVSSCNCNPPTTTSTTSSTSSITTTKTTPTTTTTTSDTSTTTPTTTTTSATTTTTTPTTTTTTTTTPTTTTTTRPSTTTSTATTTTPTTTTTTTKPTTTTTRSTTTTTPSTATTTTTRSTTTSSTSKTTTTSTTPTTTTTSTTRPTTTTSTTTPTTTTSTTTPTTTTSTTTPTTTTSTTTPTTATTTSTVTTRMLVMPTTAAAYGTVLRKLSGHGGLWWPIIVTTVLCVSACCCTCIAASIYRHNKKRQVNNATNIYS